MPGSCGAFFIRRAVEAKSAMLWQARQGGRPECHATQQQMIISILCNTSEVEQPNSSIHTY